MCRHKPPFPPQVRPQIPCPQIAPRSRPPKKRKARDTRLEEEPPRSRARPAAKGAKRAKGAKGAKGAKAAKGAKGAKKGATAGKGGKEGKGTKGWKGYCIVPRYNPTDKNDKGEELQWSGWSNDVCDQCNEGGRIMECDLCNRCFHASCLDPVLESVPTTGTFVCGELCHKELLSWEQGGVVSCTATGARALAPPVMMGALTATAEPAPVVVVSAAPAAVSVIKLCSKCSSSVTEYYCAHCGTKA